MGILQAWVPGQRPGRSPRQLAMFTGHGPGSLGKVSKVSTHNVHMVWLCLYKESGGGPQGQ